LSDSFAHLKGGKNPLIVFAGQNISEDYLFELRELLKVKEYAMAVISKSGTTTEPALAFRLLKQDIEEKYGKAELVNASWLLPMPNAALCGPWPLPKDIKPM
jgi:glucose-6-phosphate isomerase